MLIPVVVVAWMMIGLVWFGLEHLPTVSCGVIDDTVLHSTGSRATNAPDHCRVVVAVLANRYVVVRQRKQSFNTSDCILISLSVASVVAQKTKQDWSSCNNSTTSQ
jgi:hypothetical protein